MIFRILVLVLASFRVVGAACEFGDLATAKIRVGQILGWSDDWLQTRFLEHSELDFEVAISSTHFYWYFPLLNEGIRERYTPVPESSVFGCRGPSLGPISTCFGLTSITTSGGTNTGGLEERAIPDGCRSRGRVESEVAEWRPSPIANEVKKQIMAVIASQLGSRGEMAVLSALVGNFNTQDSAIYVLEEFIDSRDSTNDWHIVLMERPGAYDEQFEWTPRNFMTPGSSVLTPEDDLFPIEDLRTRIERDGIELELRE